MSLPARPKQGPSLDELPQEFRSKTIGRLQRLIDSNLTRLENEGKTIHVRDLPLQTGILLTKHAELSGIAPPSSVHNQTTVIAGIDQASARAILSGRQATIQAAQGYSAGSSNEQGSNGDRSPSITPSRPQKVLPGLPPRVQALAKAGQDQMHAIPDPFQASKPDKPLPTTL